jgi:hypothetical protein
MRFGKLSEEKGRAMMTLPFNLRRLFPISSLHPVFQLPRAGSIGASPPARDQINRD